MTDENKQQQKPQQEQKSQEQVRKVLYPEIVSRMFNLVVSRNGTQPEAKKMLVDWYNTLSLEDKIAFKASAEDLQLATKRCESAVDIIKQETAYLVHRFEQG